MYKVFIVEDDKKIAGLIAEHLKNWDMEVDCAADFRFVTKEFAESSPHIVLLDISLPFFDGYYWCKEIRKISNVPIIFISSASDKMNMLMAINMGADDFVAKPFDINLLVAKLKALLRRTYDFSHNTNILQHKGAILDIESSVFSYNGQKVDLSKNEYRIILTLMQNKDKVVSREKLMEALWQTDSFVDENTLTVNVNRLRKKLSTIGLDDFIETKFGVGYIID